MTYKPSAGRLKRAQAHEVTPSFFPLSTAWQMLFALFSLSISLVILKTSSSAIVWHHSTLPRPVGPIISLMPSQHACNHQFPPLALAPRCGVKVTTRFPASRAMHIQRKAEFTPAPGRPTASCFQGTHVAWMRGINMPCQPQPYGLSPAHSQQENNLSATFLLLDLG